MADPRRSFESIFEGNIRSLRRRDRELAERLAGLRPNFSAPACYRFLEARNGDPVPAMIGEGPARPLHSLVDPRREGARLISTLGGEDFLIFLGMGGAYHIEAALERPETGQALVVESGLRGLAELLGLRDLGRVLGDGRLRVLADLPPGALEQMIPRLYLPALSGAVRVLPLRPRVEAAAGIFEAAAAEIRAAIVRISQDYSVQAHFGGRMFRNILRNTLRAEEIAGERPLPRISRAAICAAGPSLDSQFPRIAESQEGGAFLIATDTSLPALLSAELEPDAAVSIDCQHISYRHFIPPRGRAPEPGERAALPLFLDLASPPLLASLAGRPVFFSGGHPLAGYISSRWRPFPAVDTSGGNVTYAAVSLAESLGAGEIELYGADFSYPLGRTYARGTYIFPYFEIRQNRLCPLEALFSNFLYRSPLEKKVPPQADEARRSTEARRSIEARPCNKAWYYETETLIRYREVLEAKVERMKALPAGGLRLNPPPRPGSPPKAPALSARDFLSDYREKIRSLPAMKSGSAADYPAGLSGGERQILATLLPLTAALRRKDPRLKGATIIEETRNYSVSAIDRVLVE
ncbi:MAG: DUF115 domain-containing protein [Treponema sp.]|jgi:hypothetical protein|nr:DUF115 domain-containing protein [Treponema sp.]